MVDKAAQTDACFRDRLAQFAGHPMVGEQRGEGLVTAVDPMPHEQGGRLKPGTLGAAMSKLLFERGAISRPVIEAMAFCPPLIIERGECDLISTPSAMRSVRWKRRTSRQPEDAASGPSRQAGNYRGD